MESDVKTIILTILDKTITIHAFALIALLLTNEMSSLQ